MFDFSNYLIYRNQIACCHRQDDILKQEYQPVNNVRSTPPERSITRQLATSVGASGNHHNETGKEAILGESHREDEWQEREGVITG